jgi:hypothetical protein
VTQGTDQENLMTLDPIAVSRRIREMMIARCRALGAEPLHRVPMGFTSNLIWHLGHVAVTTGMLVQGRCGLPHPLGAEAVASFKKDTSPSSIKRRYTLDELADLHERSLAAIETDRAAGRLAKYEAYTTSAGIELASAEDAVAFNMMHDGIHQGYVLALARAVAC